MVDPDRAGEILKRALAYPHGVPGRSFVLLGERVLEPGEREPDSDRTGREGEARSPLLAYGSNAAPAALARKLAPLPEVPLPVLGAALAGYDVVYSAHVSARGSVPATLHRSPGTTVRVAVLLATREQLALLTATEPNYELTAMRGLDLRLDDDAPLAGRREVGTYLSRHGPLSLDGRAVALAEVEVRGRRLPQLGQPQVLERLRAQLRPHLSLERFVLAAVESGGIAPLDRSEAP